MRSPGRRFAMGVALALGAIAAGCGDDTDAGSRPDEGDGTPTVTGSADGSCAYSGEGLETGLVDVALVNESDEDLYLITLRLDEGRTLDDLLAAPAELEPPDFTTISARTTEPVAPGAEATDTLAFSDPGDYVVACATARPPSEIPTVADDIMAVSAS